MSRIADVMSVVENMTKNELLETLDFLGIDRFKMSDVEKLVQVSQDYELNYLMIKLTVGTELHGVYLKKESELRRKGVVLRNRLGMNNLHRMDEEPIFTEYAIYQLIKGGIKW